MKKYRFFCFCLVVLTLVSCNTKFNGNDDIVDFIYNNSFCSERGARACFVETGFFVNGTLKIRCITDYIISEGKKNAVVIGQDVKTRKEAEIGLSRKGQYIIDYSTGEMYHVSGIGPTEEEQMRIICENLLSAKNMDDLGKRLISDGRIKEFKELKANYNAYAKERLGNENPLSAYTKINQYAEELFRPMFEDMGLPSIVTGKIIGMLLVPQEEIERKQREYERYERLNSIIAGNSFYIQAYEFNGTVSRMVYTFNYDGTGSRKFYYISVYGADLRSDEAIEWKINEGGLLQIHALGEKEIDYFTIDDDKHSPTLRQRNDVYYLYR